MNTHKKTVRDVEVRSIGGEDYFIALVVGEKVSH